MARKKKSKESKLLTLDTGQSSVVSQQSSINSGQLTIDAVKKNITEKQIKKKVTKSELKSVSYEYLNKEFLFNKNSKGYDEYKAMNLKVDNFVFKELYLNPDSTFLLAVSGGVDSIAMLDIFANLTVRYPLLKLSVAHFNHKLRYETSDRDQKLVVETCKKYKIPCFSESGNVRGYAESKGIGIEYAARILRYRFLEKIAQKVQAQYLATAHTSDDSAETFFINLFRGSGLTGLSGIPSKRTLSKKLTLVRPLICLRKYELIEYAQSRKLQWCEDETNQLMQYTRNKIRLEIIPKIEEHFSSSVIGTINRAQKLLQGADSIVSKHVQKTIPVLIKDKSNGRFSIKLSLFSTLEPFLQGEVLQKVLSNNFNLPYVPMQTIDRILELDEKPVGTVCEINKNYIVLKDRDSLIFSKLDNPFDVFIPIKKEGVFSINDKKVKLEKVKKKQVKFTINPNIEFIDWDLVPSILYLRNWRQGDVFKPLGMDGSMKISDFLTNNKVTLLDKSNVLLLSTKSEIIWICGMRLSDTFKITENTMKFLRIEYINE
ncbi:MAG: tRNA lysidine(34) synthetase TilS [bacterium]